MNERLTILTGADQAFFRSLLQLLLSIRRHSLAPARLLVIDLGLQTRQQAFLRENFPEIELLKFPFENYPAFVGQRTSLRPGGRAILGYYAWKPAIIREAFEKYRGFVLWMDSATLLHGDMGPALQQIAEHGSWIPYGGHCPLARWAHPSTLQYLEVPLESFDRRTRAGGICGFNADDPVIRQLVEDWRRFALIEDCIAPSGSSLENHRYDQTILNCLLCKEHYSKRLALTDDAININSHQPVPFLTVQNIVRPNVPLWMDKVCRFYFRTRVGLDTLFHKFQHLRKTLLGGLHRIPKENYYIAGRRNNLPYSPFQRLPKSVLTSQADPFFVEKDGRAYLFFEEYCYLKNKGHISVAIVEPDLSCSAPTTVLEKDYHLSYPFLLEHNKDLYMIPETYKNSSIDLYECVDFPLEWKLRKRLMYGIDAVDTTIYYKDGRYWLFTSVREGSGRYLAIFSSPDLLSTDWEPHPVNQERLYKGQKFTSGRGAGSLFVDEQDRLVRPAQHNRNYYGESVSLKWVEVLTEDEYREVPLARVSSPFGETTESGTHHLAFNDNYFFLDIRDRFSYLPNWLRKRLP